jgi:hypothetical protein
MAVCLIEMSQQRRQKVVIGFVAIPSVHRRALPSSVLPFKVKRVARKLMGSCGSQGVRAMTVIGPTSKLNRAVRDCLYVCCLHPTPALYLADYLKRLLQSGEWRADEVAHVRSAAIRILRGVVAPHDDDGMPIGFLLEFRTAR